MGRIHVKNSLSQIVQKAFALFTEPLNFDGKSFPPPKFLIQTEMMMDTYSPGVNYQFSSVQSLSRVGLFATP